MIEKLQDALSSLLESVEEFEQNFDSAMQKMNKPNARAQTQKDLFSVPPTPLKNQNSEMMTEMLDRAINRVEQLVGEKQNGRS